MAGAPIPPHRYDGLVEALRHVFEEMSSCGLEDVLSKGGVGSILLAHRLGHHLVPGDKGADGEDAEGRVYEYKVSTTNQFDFNFGGRPSEGDINAVVRDHFLTIEGAYCGLRQGPTFERIVYCPRGPLVDHLMDYFLHSKSKTMVKNFRIEAFAELPGAHDVG